MLNDDITLVIGGCRSGKSSSALARANRIHDQACNVFPESNKKKLFIATSVPTDKEMEKRVIKHQNERGEEWQTIEEPVHIDSVILENHQKVSVILVDCLTLWTSNLMYELKSDEKIEAAISRLENALGESKCPVILVSNEVGHGVVPENQVARQFRDLAGMINQRMAKIADKVILTVAGIDIKIKPGN